MLARVALTGLLLLLSGAAGAQPPSGKIDRDVASVLRRFDVPGAAVMVIDHGRVTFTRAYGQRDKAHGLAVRTDTFFEIGSITKQFTAACILQLQEARKLKLDDPVAKYLPDAPHAKEITIRELLSHTSGLHDYFDTPGADQLSSKPISYDALIARVAKLPLDFPPGSRWSYSNTGYQMLGRIIAKVSGETYKDYLQHHVLDPLHMTDTYTIPDESRLSNMAIGYRHVNGKLEAAPVIHVDWGGAAGLLVSTMSDLSKWDVALRGGKVVSPADYKAMTTAYMTSANGSADYGLGLFVDSLYGQPRIGHTGGTNGSTTADEYFPQQDVRILAFTNSGDGPPEAGETLTSVIFADLFPAIAAKALQPAPGENAAITQTVRAAFVELQAGKDYAHFTAHLKQKLGEGSGAKFAANLGSFGAPSAEVFKGVRHDGKDVWYDYAMQFGPGVSLPFGVKLDDHGAVAGLSVG
ncbi:MAG TPA: serine hydrolase domain-containing protein [Rhizomicrobium sp.]